jgi:hypothetical protein
MNYIPGWPSLTEVDFNCTRPNPFPGSVSDFDDWISKFDNMVEDAAAQVRRNKDAERMEKRDIAEEQRYIARLIKLIAELQRKGKKVDETFYLNIENAQEKIAESEKVLSMLPAHRKAWEKALAKCKPWLKWCRDVRRQGINRKTGEPRKCGSRKTDDGSPCQNPMHFRDKIGWRYCTIEKHIR